MAKKVSAAKFAAFLKKRLAAKDGYIFGATGQDPRRLSDWYFSGQYGGARLRKALYWREHAKRVWDCNGLAEGYYKDVTGVGIDARARDNFAAWCGTKGEGRIPARYRRPGAAVFKRSSYIHHVGFLVEPVEPGKSEGDWYVIEARGVMYGVIRSRLYENDWNCWGLMTKYFDYGALTAKPEPLRKEPAGDAGDESPLARLRVTAEVAANVRGGPGIANEVLTTVRAGEEFDSLALADNGWRCVRVEGRLGWISPKMCEVIQDG